MKSFLSLFYFILSGSYPLYKNDKGVKGWASTSSGKGSLAQARLSHAEERVWSNSYTNFVLEIHENRG